MNIKIPQEPTSPMDVVEFRQKGKLLQLAVCFFRWIKGGLYWTSNK